MRITLPCLATVGMLTLACGGQDSTSPSTPGGAPDVSAPSPAAEKSMSEAARSCLDLVEQRRWSEALDTCMQAARELPEDESIQSALETAQAELADASEMGRDAAEQARERLME